MNDKLATTDYQSPIYHLTGNDTIYLKPLVFRRKNYPYWCIEYILEGAGFLTIDNQHFHPTVTDVYILPKGKDHVYWPDEKDPWRKLFIVIDGPLINDLLKTYEIQNTFYFPKQEDTAPLFKKLLEAIKDNDKNTNTSVSLLVHEIIIHLASKTKRPEKSSIDLPTKIKQYLDENVEKPFCLEDLATEFKCNKNHLGRVFKIQFKITPYEYLLTKKYNLAYFYLTETGFTIKQIADKLHFSDEYSFSKFFSKRAKIPPGQFRKKHVEII